MILSGIVLSIIGTVAMAGLLSLSSLVSPNKNTNKVNEPLSVKASHWICDNSHKQNDSEALPPDMVKYPDENNGINSK